MRRGLWTSGAEVPRSDRGAAPCLLLCFLLILGALFLPQDASAGVAVQRVSGPSPFAACSIPDPGGHTVPITNWDVEPNIAADPRTIGSSHVHLAGLWQQDRGQNGGGARGLMAAVSDDGGVTWRSQSIPLTQCSVPSLSFIRASDPWVSIGPDGIVYASALGVTPQGDLQIMAGVSADGGITWSHWQTIPAPNERPASGDKESIAANPSRPGTAYIVWDGGVSTAGRPEAWAMFAETTDGGKTWSPARPVTSPRSGDTFANEILAAPDGHTLYDVFEHQRVIRGRPQRLCVRRRCVTLTPFPTIVDLSIEMFTSRDGGASWGGPRLVARVAPFPDNGVRTFVRDPGIQSAAVGPTGQLAVVWADPRDSRHGTPDIVVSTSTDRGATWSRPALVSPSDGSWHLLPTVAIAGDGTIGVTYDGIAPEAAPRTLPTDTWFAAVSPRGDVIDPPELLAGPEDLAWAPTSADHFIGDYQGLAASDSRFFPLFVMPDPGNVTVPTAVYCVAGGISHV
ncbi:MAG TPA: sialidase family protein [Chloroflexota bacterium]|nr:sialidase family protein [Chloroflexota bacterium]